MASSSSIQTIIFFSALSKVEAQYAPGNHNQRAIAASRHQ
jgi:hypothetical protein